MSPAVGLSVPTSATASRTGKTLVDAKAMPVAAASSAARHSVRRRPARSTKTPTSSVAAAVPSNVTVAMAPMRQPEKPSSLRYAASSTLTKPSPNARTPRVKKTTLMSRCTAQL